MKPIEIKYDADEDSFRLAAGHEIYVTNKFLILSGPEEWLAPVGLASLVRALRAAGTDETKSLYVSSDPPNRFDARYPGHIQNVSLALSEDHRRICIVLSVEHPSDGDPDDVRQELAGLLQPLVSRYAASRLEVSEDEDMGVDWFSATFDISTRGKSVADALAIGREALATIQASTGGALDLQSSVDLLRAGYAQALVGHAEGPWFDGKSAPYRIDDESQKWELAKDVASFANSPTGGLIVIGARTVKHRDGDVVRAMTDFDLLLLSPDTYRRIISGRIHPRIDGLEIRTIPTSSGRGIAFIFVPSQREEMKPFVVKGAVVSGKLRATYVSIPERDGEDTRYADASEVHSLLQAGRVALRTPPGRSPARARRQASSP